MVVCYIFVVAVLQQRQQCDYVVVMINCVAIAINQNFHERSQRSSRPPCVAAHNCSHIITGRNAEMPGHVFFKQNPFFKLSTANDLLLVDLLILSRIFFLGSWIFDFWIFETFLNLGQYWNILKSSLCWLSHPMAHSIEVLSC